MAEIVHFGIWVDMLLLVRVVSGSKYEYFMQLPSASTLTKSGLRQVC